MALKKDKVQLEITIGNDKARKQLADLESEASKLTNTIKSVKKEHRKYDVAAKKMVASQENMQKSAQATKLLESELEQLTAQHKAVQLQVKKTKHADQALIAKEKELIASIRTKNEELKFEAKRFKSLEKEQVRLIATMKRTKQGNDEYIAASKKLKEVQANIKKIRGEFDIMKMSMSELGQMAKTLELQLKKAVPGSEAYIRYEKKLLAVNNRLKDLKIKSKGAAQAQVNLKSKIGSVADSLNKYQTMIGVVGGAVYAFGATVGQVISGLTTSADQISEVSKTTGLVAEDVKKLKSSFDEFDTRTANKQLLEFSRIAGKLGIKGRENIKAFVEEANVATVALGKSLGGSAEVTVNTLGKIIGSFELEKTIGWNEAIRKTGAVINELGKSSTASEKPIVEYINRLQSIGVSAGIPIEKIAAIGATLDDAGIAAEAGGSGIIKFISSLSTHTTEFAKLLDVSEARYKEMLSEDVNDVMIKVLESAKGGETGLLAMTESLDKADVSGVRMTITVGTLMNKIEKLKEQQNIATKAFSEGTSTQAEYDLMNNNFAGTVEKVQKKLAKLFLIISTMLQPGIEVFIKLIDTLMVKFGSVKNNADKVGAVIKKISDFFVELIVSSGDLVNITKDLYGGIFDLFKVLWGLVQVLFSSNKEMSAAKTIIKVLSAIMIVMTAPLRVLVWTLTKLYQSFTYVYKNSLLVRKAFAFMTLPLRTLIGFFKAIYEWSTKLYRVFNYLSENSKTLKKIFALLAIPLNGLVKAFKAVSNWVGEMYKGFSSFIKKSVAVKVAFIAIAAPIWALIEALKIAGKWIDKVLHAEQADTASKLAKKNAEASKKELELQKKKNAELIAQEEEKLKNLEDLKANSEKRKLEAQKKADKELSEEEKKKAKKALEARKKDNEMIKELMQSLNLELITDERKKALKEIEIWHQAEINKVALSKASAELKFKAIQSLDEVHRKKRLEQDKKYYQESLDVFNNVQDFIKEKQSELYQRENPENDNEISKINEKYDSEIEILDAQLAKKNRMYDEFLLQKNELESLRDSELLLLKEERERELAERINSIKEEYGLVTDEDSYLLELEKLNGYYDNQLISTENFEMAKAEIQQRYATLQEEKDKVKYLADINRIQGYISYYQEGLTLLDGFITAQKENELVLAEGNEEKKKEIMKKYADKEFAVKTLSILGDTAMAIMKGYAQLGPIGGSVAAVILGATGALQVQKANEQREQVKQLAKGKYPVIGVEDGKTYNPDFTKKLGTGIIRRPTLVAEEPEMVVDHKTLYNPRTDQYGMTVMDHARAITSLKYPVVSQRASGNYENVTQGGSSSTIQEEAGLSEEYLMEIVEQIKLLRTDVASQKSLLKAYVLISELEAVQAELEQAKDSAAA